MTRLGRQLPRISEIVRFAMPAVKIDRPGNLSRVRTVEDFRRMALKRTPQPVFDYVAGGAEQELSMNRAVDAFTRVVFHPHVLRNVSSTDVSTTILGRSAEMPVVLAPTASPA